MEPAYQIAGDTFDYGIADGKLHLSLFDAMGHDVAAGLTANLASAACRNHRRQNVALADLGGAIEQTLLEHSVDKKRYLAAVLAELDLTTSELSWTNHGHHPPVVIRDNTWFSTLHCPPSHPLGTQLDLPVTEVRRRLIHSVMDYHHGHLTDDATVLLLEAHASLQAERV